MEGSMSLLRKPIVKVLGDPRQARSRGRYQSVVDPINDLEAEMSALTDDQLRDKTSGNSGSASG